MRRLLSLLSLSIAILLLAASTGCAHSYSGGPWMGKVVDAETKQPIEGAAVLAVWEDDYAAPPGRGTAFVDAVEALTDKEGYFKIPAQSFIGIHWDSKIYGPLFKIYKPGYECFGYGEGGLVTGPESWHVYPKGWKGRFEKPNAMVELKKAKTREERIKALHCAEDAMDNPKSKIPKMIKVIREENISLGFQPPDK